MPQADTVISSLSTEYIQVPVQAIVNGAPYNPTSDTVYMAFVPVGSSNYPVTWYQGSWSTTVQGNYLAQCLIGPLNGGVVLPVGYYVVWVKVTDSPEVPVKPSGTVQIT